MSRLFTIIFLLISTIICSSLHAQSIRDYAQFFSIDAATRVQKKIELLEKDLGTSDLIILETYPEISSETSIKQFYQKKFPRVRNFKGIYILMTKKPKKIIFGSSKSLQSRLSKASLDESRSILLSYFKKHKFDEGLEQSIDHLGRELTLALKNSKTNNKVQVASTQLTEEKKQSSSGFSFSSFVIWGAIILCILFLISRLFASRAQETPFSRGDSSTPPNGWNRDQPSSGGSGILGSVLGGVGGAIAGNWMYDKFFGSNTSETPTPTPPAPTSNNTQPLEQNSPNSFSEPEIGDTSGDFSSNDDWGGDDDSGGDDDW